MTHVFVSCSYCGISKDISFREFKRRVLNGKLQFFCSRSCSGKYGNDLRWDLLPQKPTGVVLLAKYITLAKDSSGNYMPISWVRTNIKLLIPNVEIDKVSDDSIEAKRNMWTE